MLTGNKYIRCVPVRRPGAAPTKTGVFAERRGEHYGERTPLFLNEEEVTRAGTIVGASHQRARWYCGRIIHWLGRSKTTGRGEGSAGLSFDNLE